MRDIAATKTILQNTANPAVIVTAQTCGGTPSTQIPNNSFGYGRVDALAAVNAVAAQPQLQRDRNARHQRHRQQRQPPQQRLPQQPRPRRHTPTPTATPTATATSNGHTNSHGDSFSITVHFPIWP